MKMNPMLHQQALLTDLIKNGKGTEWGKMHHFKGVERYADFSDVVPLQDYESLKPYIDRIRDGEQNVLWPTEIKWFAKSFFYE